MKKYIIILIAALFFGCSDKKNQEIYLMEIGKPAPKLALKRFVYPKKTKFEGLDKFKGRAIILSFFASWQENSVSGLEKINFFHEEFKLEPAVFISITDESKSDIGRFLRKHNIKGYLGAGAS
ncbi:MAG: redoxin domain-containing protein, partial [Elusimicrobiales bacterium]|nr:redoxin domain-containing protein [Elusimicrobiales bacterium]